MKADTQNSILKQNDESGRWQKKDKIVKNVPEKRTGITLRIPFALKEKMEIVARINKRSMTKEIEIALEKYVEALDNQDTTVAS